jgi:hypothetical protein
MQYEIRKGERGFIIYRVGPLNNREVWDAIHRSWDTRESLATPYTTENSVKETVRRNKFFPCIIVQEEVLPPPELEDEEEETPTPEVPTLTFKDLCVNQKYICFSGNDPSQHYVFRKVSDTDAINLSNGFNRFKLDKFSLQKTVIKIQF